MSGWTHAICPRCWTAQHPEAPVTQPDEQNTEWQPCCFCHRLTAKGIYVRHDPKMIPLCHGHLEVP